MIATYSNVVNYDIIEKAVEDMGLEIIYNHKDNEITIAEFLAKVKRLPIDTIIIDLNGEINQQLLLESIKNYKIVCEKSRIIIIKSQYADQKNLIAKIVGLGIYDIITYDDDEELSMAIIQTMKSPANYRKAVKWLECIDDGKIASSANTDVRTNNNILMIFSPFSTGKTELTTNIAYALKDKYHKKVAILDLDFDKFGIAYNFNIDDIDEYMKFPILISKVSEALKDFNYISEVSEYSLKKLGISKDKMLIYTAHPLSKINVTVQIIKYMVMKINSIVDFLVIDVGANLDDAIRESLIGLININKYLVVNQNTEVLNLVTYKQIFKYDVSYDDWNIIINQYDEKTKITKRQVTSYLNNQDNTYARYKINSIYTVPHANNTWQLKAKHRKPYSYNDEYKNAIDKIIDDLLISPSKGLFKIRKEK